MLHSPCRAHQSESIERDEGQVEANPPEPKDRFADGLVQRKAEGFCKPVSVAGKRAEKHAADDDVVKMGSQKQAVVEDKVQAGSRATPRSYHQ